MGRPASNPYHAGVTMVLKLLLAPALVVASSLAGRRWGRQVSGTLVALPIVAGPILLITGLEQGEQFGSRAASAALLGLISLAVFALIFAWSSRHFGWVGALLISWASCLLIDLGLSRLTLDPTAGLRTRRNSPKAVSRSSTRTSTSLHQIRSTEPLGSISFSARSQAALSDDGGPLDAMHGEPETTRELEAVTPLAGSDVQHGRARRQTGLGDQIEQQLVEAPRQQAFVRCRLHLLVVERVAVDLVDAP